MTNITNNTIIKDWGRAFPNLSKYKSMQLIRIVGPIAMGINLNKIFPTTYRPEFVVYNLINDLNAKPVPVVYQVIEGKNRVAITIPFDKHEKHLLSSIQLMIEQSVIDISSTPDPENIITGIIRFLDKDYMQATNRFFQFKAIAMLSRLIEDSNKSDYYWLFAINGLKEFSQSALDACTGGFDIWLEKLRNIEPLLLQDNIQMNIERWKLPCKCR